MGLSGQRHAPAVSPGERDPVPIVQEVGWPHKAGVGGCGKSRPYRNSIPEPSGLYRVAIPTAVSRPTCVYMYACTYICMYVLFMYVYVYYVCTYVRLYIYMYVYMYYVYVCMNVLCMCIYILLFMYIYILFMYIYVMYECI